jgi:hypothetical protein
MYGYRNPHNIMESNIVCKDLHTRGEINCSLAFFYLGKYEINTELNLIQPVLVA